MDILSPQQVSVQIDFEEAHSASVGLLDFLEAHNTKVSLAVVAMVLSVGRLLAPEDVSDEDEVKFVQSMLDFMGAYYAKGQVN